MTQTTLAFDKPLSFTERVAQVFHKRPNQWIDGREFASIAGFYGWSARIRDCRKAPLLMTIENRQRRVTTEDGRSYCVSEYRFLPDDARTT